MPAKPFVSRRAQSSLKTPIRPRTPDETLHDRVKACIGLMLAAVFCLAIAATLLMAATDPDRRLQLLNATLPLVASTFSAVLVHFFGRARGGR